jgi:DNA-binding MarR family transcriptional regulator
MPAIPALAAHTGYLLRMVSNAVSQDFARRIAGAGVTVAEWVVLRSLYDADAMAPSTLAGKMGMTKGAISKLADRLLEKGLIERIGSPDDRRMHSLCLSKEGRDKVPMLAALADSNEAEHFGLLTAAEHDALDSILKALIERRKLSIVPVD